MLKIAANVILKFTNRFLGIKRALLLYRLVQVIFLPFVILYFTARLLRSRSYWSHFSERFGFISQLSNRTKSESIWLHAVSVGEVSSVMPLVRRLKKDQPTVTVYLSTSTVAGRKAAYQQASSLIDGIFYSPLDYAFCVRRVLRAIRPALLVILETEIWPNLYAETKRFGASLAIVNGRISDRTWPRYRSWKRWVGPVLELPDLIFVQSSKDHERYAELGAPQEKLVVAPNLKYDAAISTGPSGRSESLSAFGAQQVWIAASTVGPNERGSLRKHSIDEDDEVLKVFQQLAREFPKLLLVLAPRQPARFEEVAGKLKRRNVNFLRRTDAKKHPELTLTLPGVLLLDTMGDLAGTYGLADVTFVGGSLAPRGGHNIVEPAAAGSPIVVGPHMENFASIAQDFIEAEALVKIRVREELLPAVRGLLMDGERARHLGMRAMRLVEARSGNTNQLAERLWLLYHGASLRKTSSRWARMFLRPLAGLWTEGGILKRKHSEHFTLISPPLPVPVVSIGGITVGGSGKTPFTAYVVRRLASCGHSPAIVTRGYGRRTPTETLVFAPGARVPAALTGDEAQIFLRATDTPIGIGTKRYETAQILLRQFPSTSVVVLDDGFQHARLEHDFDVVVIDGLDPFGGEEVVPLGRLREPLDALSRADAFVVTRAEEVSRFEAIRQRLQKLNPKAPVFRTRLIARSWRDYRGQMLPTLQQRKVGAFCGLGNPENFWQTLESLGLEVVFRWCFADHHAYNPTELQRVAHQARMRGAEMLVTTEKDRINCPAQLECAIAPLGLAWLEIELELENELEFFAVLEKSLHRTRPKQFVL
jgi:3-deoxy-D-manno-octulosonic-acid transferase